MNEEIDLIKIAHAIVRGDPEVDPQALAGQEWEVIRALFKTLEVQNQGVRGLINMASYLTLSLRQIHLLAKSAEVGSIAIEVLCEKILTTITARVEPEEIVRDGHT